MIKLAIPSCTSPLRGRPRILLQSIGFKFEFAHCADQTMPDPCYVGISRDGVWLNISLPLTAGRWVSQAALLI